MSQAQPLSTLAPEFGSQYAMMPGTTNTVIVDSSCLPKCPPPKKPCPPRCPPKPCPPKCPPKPCETPCPPKPCEKPCGRWGGWGWLGALVLWFIIFTVLFWLIFYSLAPAFVLQNGSNQVDTAKVLLAAVIAALILVIIIWLIKAAVSRRRY